MRGKNFSIKNYVTKYWDKQKLDFKKVSFQHGRLYFGDSNLYKAIAGGLIESEADFDANMIFFRGMNYITDFAIWPNSTEKIVVTEHFNHLRAIYEIKGSGLEEEVDFVIWNDPRTENIIVRDTDSLFKNIVLNQSHVANVFGQIGLTFRQFLYSDGEKH